MVKIIAVTKKWFTVAIGNNNHKNWAELDLCDNFSKHLFGVAAKSSAAALGVSRSEKAMRFIKRLLDSNWTEIGLGMASAPNFSDPMAAEASCSQSKHHFSGHHKSRPNLRSLLAMKTSNIVGSYWAAVRVQVRS